MFLLKLKYVPKQENGFFVKIYQLLILKIWDFQRLFITLQCYSLHINVFVNTLTENRLELFMQIGYFCSVPDNFAIYKQKVAVYTMEQY